MPRSRLVRHAAAAFALALGAASSAASSAAAQDTHIHGFTDVTAQGADRRGPKSAVALGQFDLYITSAIADRVSFLGETVFEYDDAARAFGVDVERVIIGYQLTDHLRFAAGKHHTPIGYWNNAYHHGALIQPTIDRPLLFRFEDQGGVLPIHTTGALLTGRDLTAAHLGFDVMVGNGASATPTRDDNQAKSITAAVSSQVTSALQVGASAYTDRLPAGALDAHGLPLPSTLQVGIVGGYAAFTGARAEAILEYQHVRNTLAGASAASHRGNDGYVAYAGYRVGKVVPYVRYDALRFDRNDPYFVADDARTGLLGARYDLAATATVKLELRRQYAASSGSTTRAVAQFAIGF